MAEEPELEMSDWQPHRLSDFQPSQAPTIRLLNTFGEAFHSGRIPTRCWRATAPDYSAQQILITIFPDDAEFRRAVAEVLPQGRYRIEVADRRGVAL